jgi:NADP-dependent 3-hydroxy acid dehydrogenase YdfG
MIFITLDARKFIKNINPTIKNKMAAIKRVALVTGASRGIGAGISKYLANKDYFVYATYLKDKKLIEKEFKNFKNV